MITALKFFTAVLLLASAGSALASVHYVDVNSTNATPPYTNWTTAATNIQDAVDAAVAGDEIVVTNGIYAMCGPDGNVVNVNKPIGLRSVNGPGVSTIDGGSSCRCVLLTNGASLSGFTLTNGAADYGGGAYGGTLSNCTLTGNLAYGDWPNYSVLNAYGGGAYDCTLNHCTLRGNSADVCIIGGYFGEIYLYAQGGGAFGCTLNNCTLSGNSAGATNYAGDYNGHDPVHHAHAYGGGAYGCAMRNCSLSGNSAGASVGLLDTDVGAEGGGAFLSTLNNSIVFHNTHQGICEDCNFRDPLFVDTNGWANLRLQFNSPYINAGDNAFVPAGPDLDGNPRIAGGTVDIGAYEFQSPASTISYAWLQQYGLPINSSTDSADPDGDGVDIYHEWRAGTDPTNPLSSPAQLTIIPSGANLILTWPTNAIGFTLQSTTNLGSPAAWATNCPAPVVIGGQNTVTNPIAGAQQFYRLVQ